MELYESEEEQVEALKRWWSENGKTIIAGVVIGLGAIVGWTSWQEYQRSIAEAASAAYETQIAALAREDYAAADAAGQEILESYGGTGYPAMAALVLARSSYAQGRSADARRHLQWILENSDEFQFQLVARLALADLALDANEPDAALALLEVEDTGEFAAAFEELRGDVYVDKGELDKAREAYTSALDKLESSPQGRDTLELKLGDLGHTNYATD